jgi:glycosyltransferase involved in cell wall biosynthesis
VSRVTQAIAAAAPGDAVTNQAFAYDVLLREWGFETRIVAEHVHPSLAGRVRRLDGGGRAGLGGEPVILHLSIWSAAVRAALATPGPLALVYHNITPGDLLRPVSPDIAAECDRARQALPALRGRTDVVVADSSFNADELAAVGIDAEVVPLLLELDGPARPVRAEAGDPPTVLSVGRLAPSKRVEDAIGAFHLFQSVHAPRAELVLVGSEDGFAPYRAALGILVARLGVRGVRFAGRVSDAERDALYARADAYLCMSEHEGFCAPLVEAMAHGVPVVARRAGAVPETVGGGGIVVERDLPLVAEALAEVVSSPATRRGLAAGARRRLAELDPAVTARRLREVLAPVLWPDG